MNVLTRDNARFHSRPLTILASGPSLHRVLHDPSLVEGSVAVVNTAGLLWPGPIDFWVTLHPDRHIRRYQRRRELGYSMDFISVVPKMEPKIREHFEDIPHWCTEKAFERQGGSSSFYALTTLSGVLGFSPVYLFGIDLTGEYWAAYSGPWARHAHVYRSRVLNYPNELTRIITQGQHGIYPEEL